MTDKYIDLHDRIADEIHWDATVIDVLRWLDDHLDQVPGQTITEQRLIQLWRVTVEGRSIDDFAQELKDNGITVVPDPDPEPTNAEKLSALYDQWLESDAPACRVSFERFMDEAGVRAPGGDDG